MQKLGYGPDKRLKVKLSSRDIPPYRDPAIILIDQLKEVYIDGELETIDTTNWFPKIMRKDFTVGLNLTPNFVDDPTRPSTGTLWAVLGPTITAIAIPRLTSWSTRKRPNPAARSATGPSGRLDETLRH